MKTEGGGGCVNELSLRFIILLLHGLYCVLSVTSDLNLDEPGFTAPATSTAPPSSDPSVDNPPEGRCKCIACPRRMRAKTADRHAVVLYVGVLIVLSNPAAKSALSGRMRRFVCTLNCVNP